MKNHFTFLLLSYLFTSNAQTINAELNFSKTHSISPFIYGYNQDHQQGSDEENWTIRRLGGNRLSVFNWENGASNAGHDNLSYPNDNRIPSLIGVPWKDKDKIGEAYRFFHQENLDDNIASIITVPLLGWVAADKNGSNLTSPPSSRWDEVIFKKTSSFSLTPSLTDNKIYVDESVYFLTQAFGNATTKNGIKYISLDNEPALWSATHDLLQKEKVTISEYVQKIIEASKAIKAVDPNVKIIIGEFAGINLYDLGGASDWQNFKGKYDWFPSYLLDTLKKESDKIGYQLVDIISFHNYPQHKINTNGDFDKNGMVVRTSSSTANHIRQARMNFPRSLWDENYIEESWLTNSKLKGESNKILVRMQHSIDTYFPNIKMMIGEYDYGHDTDISHGIGTADFLGVMTQHNVEIVTRWDLQPGNKNTYTSPAYKLFRNYDNQKSTFGDVSIHSQFDNVENGSVWASIDSDDNDLHLILINKNIKNTSTFNINVNNKNHTFNFKEAFYFNDQSTTILEGKASDITILDNLISCSIPPLTSYHLIIKQDKITSIEEVKSEIDWKVYPTNFDNELTIKTSNVVENIEINILSLEGKMIQKVNFEKGKEFYLSTKNLSKGSYLLKFTSKQFSKQEVILKK